MCFVQLTDKLADSWPAWDWCDQGLLGLTQEEVVKLKVRLGDLRTELSKLNTETRTLVFVSSVHSVLSSVCE